MERNRERFQMKNAGTRFLDIWVVDRNAFRYMTFQNAAASNSSVQTFRQRNTPSVGSLALTPYSKL